MREAENFIREYYVELSKYSSDFAEALSKEKDRQEIFDRAYKGDQSDREYVKKHMMRVLTDKSFRQVKKDSDFIVDDTNIDVFLNLREVPEDRFRVVLHDFRKQHGQHALHAMIEVNKFYELSANKDICVITTEMINQAYEKTPTQLEYEDKLEILVQKLYENFKGFPVIDNLIYQKVEDIQVGVSGHPEEAHKSIWIVIDGRLCHLEFLSLKDEAQLEDVCRKMAGDEKIDSVSPYAFAFGEDGSRRVSFKKGFSETWCGIIRKLNTVENMYNKDLLVASGVKDYEKLILLEKLLMKGSISTVLIGDQGSGKTVKTVCLVEYIYDDYPVRT
ncbi:MAG: hypothetical protein JXN10_10110, partial [Clostridia bacterium]|nr:hypothetical protein [Clostridia bacterium]